MSSSASGVQEFFSRGWPNRQIITFKKDHDDIEIKPGGADHVEKPKFNIWYFSTKNNRIIEIAVRVVTALFTGFISEMVLWGLRLFQYLQANNKYTLAQRQEATPDAWELSGRATAT